MATAAQKVQGLVLAEVPKVDAALGACRAVLSEASGILASTLLTDTERAAAGARLKGRWQSAVAALRAAAMALPDDFDTYTPPTELGP